MLKIRQVIQTTILFILAVMLTACGSISTPTPVPEIAVDGQFKEFYNSLGGRGVLGPATVGSFEYNGLTCQYTSNALMCHDPLAADAAHRFKLLPLGTALNVNDLPDAPNGAEGARVIDGYILYPAFEGLYDQLRGAEYAGRPLTRARYNYLQRRIEQYFENVGFFQSLDDDSQRVCLLAYGMAACQGSCQTPPLDPCLGVINPSQQPVEQPFLEGLVTNKLLVLGQPLSVVYMAEDGLLRQVYEAGVVYSPSGNSADLRLLPLAKMLNMPSDEPVTCSGTNISLYTFYNTQNEYGQYIFNAFLEYIEGHGGLVMSGAPISAAHDIGQDVIRQCFENYCLEYNPSAAREMQVRLSALGIQFLQTFPIDSSLLTAPLYSAETIQLEVGAHQPTLKQDELQTLVLQIKDRQKQAPIAGVVASVRLFLPDGSELTSTFPPTGMNGDAELTLEALPKLENSSIIPYEVCLNVSSPQPICVNDSFMLWN